MILRVGTHFVSAPTPAHLYHNTTPQFSILGNSETWLQLFQILSHGVHPGWSSWLLEDVWLCLVLGEPQICRCNTLVSKFFIISIMHFDQNETFQQNKCVNILSRWYFYYFHSFGTKIKQIINFAYNLWDFSFNKVVKLNVFVSTLIPHRETLSFYVECHKTLFSQTVHLISFTIWSRKRFFCTYMEYSQVGQGLCYMLVLPNPLQSVVCVHRYIQL